MAKTLRLACLLLAFALVPALAHAQLSVYQPSQPAVGESYHFEFTLGMWNPTPAITLSSGRLSAPAGVVLGTEIDAVKDLGFTSAKFREIGIVVRPATKHKIRFGYVPAKYSADAVLTRTLTFKGQTYTVGLPVNSSLTWKAYRFGYEYDFLYRQAMFLGIIGEVKYIDAEASIASPLPDGTASTRQKVPIPTIGGIARGYLARNVSITAELTGFKLPDKLIGDWKGRAIDYDIYGTMNFSDNAAAQGGYRSMEAKYDATDDHGDLTLKGWYIRGVLRF